MKWSLITAANNDAVLQSCLAASPAVARACDFQVMRGFPCGGAAYNAGIRRATGDVLVFAHQDVYLPEEWDARLDAAVSCLSERDPNWAVLGIWGITTEQESHGHMYCTGLQKVLGKPFAGPVACNSLDEVVLVLRGAAGLTFDERLPGFHFYGTGICLEAQQRGLTSHIVSAFCIHNTAGIDFLPWAFWRAYLFMRRKWWKRLPITTPCIRITRSAFPVLQHPLQSYYVHYVKRQPPGRRIADPAALHRELLCRNAVVEDRLKTYASRPLASSPCPPLPGNPSSGQVSL